MQDTKKQKILIYYNSMDTAGGIERVIANLANNWFNKYSITILVKDAGNTFYHLEKEIKIASLNINCKLNMKNKTSRIYRVGKMCFESIKAIKKYLTKNIFDWIYTATPMQCFEMVCAGYGSKVIATEHASATAYNKIYQIIKDYSYKRVHAVVAPTTMDTHLYRKKSYPVVYIPHLTTFSAKKLGDWETKTFFNVGRLTADKQQLLLLKMWKKFQSNQGVNQWQLVIAGEGEERQHLLNYIKDNDLHNVTLTGSTNKIEDYYSNATYFLFTSRMEGFGMVLLEAMAYGIPCISFDCPSGPRDIIKNSENGWLISCYDELAFCEKIKKCTEMNEKEYMKYSKNALKTVENWPNIEVLKSWDKIFKSRII